MNFEMKWDFDDESLKDDFLEVEVIQLHINKYGELDWLTINYYRDGNPIHISCAREIEMVQQQIYNRSDLPEILEVM